MEICVSIRKPTNPPSVPSTNQALNSKNKIKNVRLKEVKTNDRLIVESWGSLNFGGPKPNWIASGNSVYTNAKLIELFNTVRLPSNIYDVLCFSINEFIDGHGNKYLVLKNLLRIPLVVKDILHIGKGFIQIGVDTNKKSNDNTIICLGLSGLLLIECKPESYIKQKKYCIKDISKYCAVDCIPYSKLTTKEQVLTALSKLESLDRGLISNYDIELILRAAKNNKYKLISHNDMSKLTLSEKYTHDKRFKYCKRRNAVLNIYGLEVRNPLRTVYNSIDFRSSKNIFFISLIFELSIALTDMYGYIEGDSDIYSNIRDVASIRDFGNYEIGAYPGYSLKQIGYVALLKLNKIDEVYPELMPRKEDISNIYDRIYRADISGNVLDIQYEVSQRVCFDLNSLIRLYNEDRDIILKHRVLAERFNAKHSLLGDSLEIDGMGLIVGFDDKMRIRQSGPIRGIDLSKGSGTITVDVTDKFIIERRLLDTQYSKQYSKQLSLAFNINTLVFIDRLEFTLTGRQYPGISLIFNLDGVTNQNDLEKMVLVYWFYLSRLPDEHKNEGMKFYIEGHARHVSKFISRHHLACLENVLCVDKELRLNLVENMISIMGELEKGIRKGAYEFILDFISYIIPDRDGDVLINKLMKCLND